jgi:hypothetical protein
MYALTKISNGPLHSQLCRPKTCLSVGKQTSNRQVFMQGRCSSIHLGTIQHLQVIQPAAAIQSELLAESTGCDQTRVD